MHDDPTAAAGDETVLRTAGALPRIGPGTRLLKGKFELGERLGGGGMGIVYQAVDTDAARLDDPNARIAIKVLSEAIHSFAEAPLALQRESSRARRLAHPNIVRVYEFYQDANVCFITMEFLQGRSWDRLFRERAGGAKLAEARPLIEQLCSALAYAHGEGVVHSDLKPGNLFLTDGNVVKVLDFGIAAPMHLAAAGNHETLYNPRRLGALSTTHACLEMWQGLDADPRDDIYSLGCIVYELLSGRHPFGGATASQVFDQQLVAAPLPALSRAQNLALQHALAIVRRDRTPSVQQFMAEFWTSGGGRRRVHPGSWTGIGAAIVAAAAALSYWLLGGSHAATRTSQLSTASVPTSHGALGSPAAVPAAAPPGSRGGVVPVQLVRSPPDARVFIDGAKVGAATVSLTPGPHQLTALSPGYYGTVRPIAVAPTGGTPIRVDLAVVGKPSGTVFDRFLTVDESMSQLDGTGSGGEHAADRGGTLRAKIEDEIESMPDPTLQAVLRAKFLRRDGQIAAADGMEHDMMQLAHLGDARAASAVALLAATERGKFTSEMMSPELREASREGDPLATFLLALPLRSELASAPGGISAHSTIYRRYCAQLQAAAQQGWAGLPTLYRDDCRN